MLLFIGSIKVFFTIWLNTYSFDNERARLRGNAKNVAWGCCESCNNVALRHQLCQGGCVARSKMDVAFESAALCNPALFPTGSKTRHFEPFCLVGRAFLLVELVDRTVRKLVAQRNQVSLSFGASFYGRRCTRRRRKAPFSSKVGHSLFLHKNIDITLFGKYHLMLEFSHAWSRRFSQVIGTLVEWL